jgi:hypothetical protein
MKRAEPHGLVRSIQMIPEVPNITKIEKLRPKCSSELSSSPEPAAIERGQPFPVSLGGLPAVAPALRKGEAVVDAGI